MVDDTIEDEKEMAANWMRWNIMGGDQPEADEEALKASIEELSLLSDIRALEMDLSIMDLQSEMVRQDKHIKRWEKMLGGQQMTPESRATIEAAQEEVMLLRQKCKAIEDERPIRPPKPSTQEHSKCPAVKDQPEEPVPTSASPGVPPQLPPARVPEQTAKRPQAREIGRRSGSQRGESPERKSSGGKRAGSVSKRHTK